MIYEYMELGDGTIITHSELKGKGEKRYVEVFFEREREEGGIYSACCKVPPYKWIYNQYFTKKELAFFVDFLEHNAPLLFECAEHGGINIA